MSDDRMAGLPEPGERQGGIERLPEPAAAPVDGGAVERSYAATAAKTSEYEPGDKSPEEIELDIARTRAELSATLDALEHHLAPRHMMEKGVNMLRDAMSGDLGTIGERIKSNPLPLALIGVGVGWLMLSGSSSSGRVGGAMRSATGRIGDSVSGMADRAGSAVRDVAGRVSDMAGDAADRVRSMVGAESHESAGSEHLAYARQKSSGYGTGTAGYGQTGGSASSAGSGQGYGSSGHGSSGSGSSIGGMARQAQDYAGYAADQAREAGSQMTTLIDEHPLVVGGLGLLAGFCLGLALPATRVEQDYLGSTGERLVDEAREAGRTAFERATDAAGAAAEAAVEAVREGITGTGEDEKDAGEKAKGAQDRPQRS